MAGSWRPGKGRIGVLRIGHRPGRDKRITTHVCLTARALGADVVYFHEPDDRVLASVDGVVQRFGGPFETHAVDSWRQVLQTWKASGAQVAHLTMYGIPLPDAIARLDEARDLLVVVGAEKVPWEVYEEADMNVSVGSQPHSEVAALALFLDRATKSEWDLRPFMGQVRVVPSEKGKAVTTGNAQ